MAHKVFVSYKYADNSVEQRFTTMFQDTTVRSYVDLLEKVFSVTESAVNKSERDGEDLSDLLPDAIKEKLKPRIHDSTVTIIMISPEMRENNKPECKQWMPWEISYSLKEIDRGGKTSQTNALLAVILPDRDGKYDYFNQPIKPPFDLANVKRYSGIISSNCCFEIIRKNIDNLKNKYKQNPIYEPSYIKSMTWDEFIKAPEEYVENTFRMKDDIEKYYIHKEIS